MLDSAVLFFGTVIENATNERIKQGQGTNVEYINKYQFADLMKLGYTLQRPPNEAERNRADLEAFKSIAGIKVDKLTDG